MEAFTIVIHLYTKHSNALPSQLIGTGLKSCTTLVMTMVSSHTEPYSQCQGKKDTTSAYHCSKVTLSMVITLMGDHLYKHHIGNYHDNDLVLACQHPGQHL